MELGLMSLSTVSDKDCVSGSERKVSPAGMSLEVHDMERTEQPAATGRSKVDNSIVAAIQENDVQVVLEWVKSLPADQRSKCVSTATPEWSTRTILHYAVIYNRPDIVKVFIEAGADLGIKERENARTVLHHACMCSSDEDIEQLIKLIVSREVDVSAQDELGYTALHYAAENGHVVASQLLLDAGADIDVRNNNQDTPLHAAAFSGSIRNVSEMIGRNPDCVRWVGHKNETPLHIACRQNHVEVAVLLLDKDADVNAVDDSGNTPLHCSASSSNRLVKIMLDRGAEINPNTGAKESPLAIACHRGLKEAVPLMLDQGAEVDPKALEYAVTEGYERIAMVLVKSSQWPKALRSTFKHEGRITSPFRELIRHMPNVAEEVLNNCTNCDPEISDPADHEYSVLFNYEFVEDLQDPNNQPVEDENTDYVSSKKRRSTTSDMTYGCGFTEVQSAPRKNYSTTWGPIEFDRDNHPLAIMVESESLQLLSHPLVASLLHSKWKKFGQYGYFVNLLAYCIYLASLTTFALLVPNPQENECVIVNCRMRENVSGIKLCENVTNITTVTCDSTSRHLRNFLYFTASIVILFALCRLVLELAQIIVLRLNYVRDWINWMEVLLFVFSIIFVWVFNTECACTLIWQWQIGALSVFLAWITLIVFISKFPLVGLYVLMFVKIFYTFLKVVILSILLVIAFALTFYMAFNDPSNIKRSPWATPYRALLKTVTMTGGEYNFDPIFRQDPAGGNDDDSEVPFYPVSYLVWILFIVLMPILLANMLVGLAVGDIQTIQDEASLQKLALQVEQVLTVEELLPTKIRRRFRSGWKIVKPNRKMTFLKKLEYIIWGGERYDTHKSISRALQSVENSNDEVNRKTKDLIHEVERLKCAVNRSQEDNSEMMMLVREIAKKHGIIRQGPNETSVPTALEDDQIKQITVQDQEDILEVMSLVREIAEKHGIVPQRIQ